MQEQEDTRLSRPKRCRSQVRVAVNHSAPPRDHIRRGEDRVGLHVLDILHLTCTREKNTRDQVNKTERTTKSSRAQRE